MFKLLDKYLSAFLKGWSSLSKLLSTRAKEQIFFLLTFVLLQQMTLIIWSLVLYLFLSSLQ